MAFRWDQWGVAGRAIQSGLVAVYEAVHRLAEWNERQSRVMTLRYFDGLTVSESAQALGVSPITVERDQRLTRALLRDQL